MTREGILNELRINVWVARVMGIYPGKNLGKSNPWRAMEQAASLIENQQNHIHALMQANDALRHAWVPVAERLPKDRGNVLVVAFWHERWGVYMGWYAAERAAWYVRAGTWDRDDVLVSCWMPLPEPPEVE